MKFKLLLLFIYFTFNLSGQTLNDPVLVKVGNLEISKTEFEDRLNFTPKEGIHDLNNSEGIKKELLYTIIAEKLWANEAIDQGLQNDTSVITAKNVMEKMFVRDELYRREIKDKINITEEKLKEAEARYSKILNLIVFYTENKSDIEALHNQILESKGISSLLPLIDTNKVLYKKMELSFGDLQKSTEDILYNLNINQFSNPIKMETGWNIFYMSKIHEREFASLNDRNNAAKFINKTLKKREEQTNYKKFFNKFFKDKKIDADGKLFMLIVKNLHSVFKKKEDKNILAKANNGDKKILFDSFDLREMEKKIGGNKLEEDFIRFKNNPINLRTFLREISFSSFSVPSSNIDSIKIYLNKKLKNYIKYELLSREGYKKGLDKSPNVVKWVNIWFENFLYQKIKNNTIMLDEQNELMTKNTKNEKVSGESKLRNFINQTIKLSDKYNYSINKKLYDSIKQGNINMFVIRNLGFGGSIAAVPSSPPFIKWYLEKEKRLTPNL